MIAKNDVKEALRTALPIMLGYVAIGLSCGILSASIGLNALQVFLMCALFYSGAGQFMIPNMWLACSPVSAIVASVSFVNTRQMLYAAALAPYCEKVSKRLAFLFAATVTDESFGVNMRQFKQRDWPVSCACLVNLFSQSSWAISSVIGVLIGNAIGVPLAIASFAMTSIFICLLVTEKFSLANLVSAVAAVIGVSVCKLCGLSGAAIFLGALFGVICADVFFRLSGKH